MLSVRDGMDAGERDRLSHCIQGRLLSLTEVQSAQTVFVYVSTRSEIHTHALIEQFVSQGKSVIVPRILGAKKSNDWRMIAVRISTFDNLKPGRYGIREPAGATPFDGPIDVCIAPGIAFTERGDRLGSGFGHYDQFLAKHPVKTTLGLAFECQIVPHIDHEPHDRRMDIIVTDQRVIRCQD
jgi:5-formyltetrahydrofolate cyclo-ligase